MTTRSFEDQVLPVEFPYPPAAPLSIEKVVRERDGQSCRLCGKTIEGDTPPLVNCRPGRSAGELAELQMALACFGCASDVTAARRAADGHHADAPRRDRALLRMLTLLYLENCQMAEMRPLQEVML